MWPLVRLWAAAKCMEQLHHCPRNYIKSILWSNTSRSGFLTLQQKHFFFLLPRVQTEEKTIICVSEHVSLLRHTVFTAQLPFCTVDTIHFSALQLTFSLFFLNRFFCFTHNSSDIFCCQCVQQVQSLYVCQCVYRVDFILIVKQLIIKSMILISSWPAC